MKKKHDQKKKKKSNQPQSHRKKARWLTGLVVIMYVVGFGIISYPFISNGLYKWAQRQAIHQYEVTVEKNDQHLQDKIKEEMQSKNERLEKEAHEQARDYAVDAEKNLLNGADRQKKSVLGSVIGVVEIPKIKIELPIYNGTNEEQISRGAGLMQGTSLPYGGEGTHSVLTAHRGLPTAKLFTDLPELILGDMFFIKVFDEVHQYQIDQIKVIDPTDFSALGIVSGADYVTLLTCTPYMVNSHRLLVRGHRVEPFEKQDYLDEKAKGRWHTLKKILLYAAIVLSVLLLFYALKRWRDRKQPIRKRRRKKSHASRRRKKCRTGKKRGKKNKGVKK